ncbi:hypothetical protein KJ780_02940 [Candidatus Micrarchaeota archaeon]|nr:hypothetical protein [Candidatus Micrarchaeota archaeon]
MTWVNINVDNASGWSEYLKFADGYDVPLKERYVPMVYVGNSYGWGIDGIRNNMGVWISECQQNGCYSPYEMLK